MPIYVYVCCGEERGKKKTEERDYECNGLHVEARGQLGRAGPTFYLIVGFQDLTHLRIVLLSIEALSGPFV